MSFPCLASVGFGFFELADARIHALRHILFTCSLGLGYEQELKLKLADLIGCLALYAHAGRTTLAFHATSVLYIFHGPLIEARYVNGERPPVSVRLVILETDVRSSETAVLGYKIV